MVLLNLEDFVAFQYEKTMLQNEKALGGNKKEPKILY
jgi:hypothetical protein